MFFLWVVLFFSLVDAHLCVARRLRGHVVLRQACAGRLGGVRSAVLCLAHDNAALRAPPARCITRPPLLRRPRVCRGAALCQVAGPDGDGRLQPRTGGGVHDRVVEASQAYHLASLQAPPQHTLFLHVRMLTKNDLAVCDQPYVCAFSKSNNMH